MIVNLRGCGDVVLLLFSMADSKFILYVRKFLKNPLLARKQVVSTKSLNLSVNWAYSPWNGQRCQERNQGQARQDPQG